MPYLCFWESIYLKKKKLKLFIKYMVSIRCKMIVKAELEKLGIRFSKVELGEVELLGKVSQDQLERLNVALKLTGLEIMYDTQKILVERIKTIIIELIYINDDQIKINLIDYLCEKLNNNYLYLSRLFSKVNGITIEQFYLTNKIDKVKELLVYDKLSLTEIAFKLNYSSVSHLSNQFKRMTGLTPSHFKKLKLKRRISLEDL
jgi:AraC-like DNA-binding protein